MTPTTQILILTHAAATLCMFAVIWFVQIVHYPLFAKVGEEAFAAYELAHQQRISFIVIPLMLAELATAGLLLWWGIDGLPRWWLWAGAGLLAIIWTSTFLIQVPLHEKLGAGIDVSAIHRLVTSNWIRTVAWSLRAALVLAILGRLLTPLGPQ